MTEIIRSDTPRRSSMAALAIGGLIVGILLFTGLTVLLALQVANGYADAEADTYMALFLGVVFVLAAVATDIYRKEFLPDELIHKIRRPKIVPPRTFR